MNGRIVEYRAWLRKEGEESHVNVAEPEAVLKRLDHVLRWESKQIDLVTDLALLFVCVIVISEGAV